MSKYLAKVISEHQRDWGQLLNHTAEIMGCQHAGNCHPIQRPNLQDQETTKPRNDKYRIVHINRLTNYKGGNVPRDSGL